MPEATVWGARWCCNRAFMWNSAVCGYINSFTKVSSPPHTFYKKTHHFTPLIIWLYSLHSSSLRETGRWNPGKRRKEREETRNSRLEPLWECAFHLLYVFFRWQQTYSQSKHESAVVHAWEAETDWRPASSWQVHADIQPHKETRTSQPQQQGPWMFIRLLLIPDCRN